MANQERTSLAAIRFGYGLHPEQSAPKDADDLLAQVRRHNRNPRLPKIAAWEDRFALLKSYRKANKAEINGTGSMASRKKIQEQMQRLRGRDAKALLEAPLRSGDGFSERLVTFWADHFTVAARGRILSLALPHYIVNAVRPHIGGTFSTLLRSVILHPAMLVYLDQNSSVGPNSMTGRIKARGLNENLARELLELHTLGVNAGYGQEDVRQLAELLTGLQVTPEGFQFNRSWAEPGSETVLGKTYGGGRAQLDDVLNALDDLAMNPATAKHLAQKLAVHFVADNPPSDLVDHVTARYQASGGDLLATYEALLDHPSAWQSDLSKVKPPADYVISAARAVGLKRFGQTVKDLRGGVLQPLVSMGQAVFQSPGPDGWPEEASHWVTPATLAARIEWAANLARAYANDVDPRAFVDTALGGLASDEVVFAAGGAETKWEGVAVVLVSPEFNRR